MFNVWYYNILYVSKYAEVRNLIFLFLFLIFLGSFVIVFYMFNVYSYYIVSRYGIICVGKSYVIFKVWVCNDVYLVLMMYDCDSGFLYEIVIGGWGNG